MNAVDVFFKMHLVLHLWSDSFRITQISSLWGPAFGLSSDWRYGDFGRIGVLFYFRQKMVMYIVTQVIMINVTIGTQGMRETPARACRKIMAGNVTCTRPFVDYDLGLKNRLKDNIKSLLPLIC